MVSTPFTDLPEDNPMLNTKYIDINNYEGLYKVGNDGSVWTPRKRLKPWIINSGYEALKITKKGVRTHILVHRIVAQHFIPNPQGKAEVNHIDGDKLNNNVCNLEWVTSSENKIHALKTGLKIYNNPTLGIRIGKSSIYRNVTWDKRRSKWQASIRHAGKTHYQRRFNTEEEAALHVNWIINELNLTDRPLNVILR